MRSSKNRSRSKGNRNRSVGNIVNRVFDSSGPEGKVRGTPQQIIDKYNQLARDAQLANDRVAAENFQQHAEHYLRMLAEAQREQDARREQQQQQNQGGNQNQPQGGGQKGEGDQPRSETPRGDQGKGRGDDGGKPTPPSDSEQRSFDAVLDKPGDDSGLVETPENKPKRTRRPRRKPGDEAEAKSKDGGGEGGGDQPPQEAAE